MNEQDLKKLNKNSQEVIPLIYLKSLKYFRNVGLTPARHKRSHHCFAERAYAPPHAPPLLQHYIATRLRTSDGGDNLTKLAADDTYINCRNKQAFDKGLQRAAHMLHTKFVNLPTRAAETLNAYLKHWYH